jgi:hypothetical protein
MTGQMRTMETEEEKRERRDRRDPLDDPRQEDRRERDQRKGERRVAGRRTDFCPTCGGPLTPTAYCPPCQVRVVKIRTSAGR